MQKAAEAQDQRKEALSNLEAASRERAGALESETKANEEKDRAEKALNLLVQAFRKPDPSIDGRSLKVVDLLDRAVQASSRIRSGDQPLDGSDPPERDRRDLRRAGHDTRIIPPRSNGPLICRVQGLGEDHPDTLKALHNLAMAHQDAGRLDEAIPILEATLARRTAKLGGDHVDMIESMNDLAVAYWESGQAARAIPLYEAAHRDSPGKKW